MKKSYLYSLAMAAVIRDDALDMDTTLEILEVLMADKSSAVWGEKLAEERKETERMEAEKNADVS